MLTNKWRNVYAYCNDYRKSSQKGTSALLADEFIRGAKEKGNSVYRFDTAFECVHPCIGCETCKCGDNPCVFQDAMMELYSELKKSDMVAVGRGSLVDPFWAKKVLSNVEPNYCRQCKRCMWWIDGNLCPARKKEVI